MDNDLVQLLRSVIREELVPVNERLDRMETEQQGMKQDQQTIMQDQQTIKQHQQTIMQDQQTIKQHQQTMMQDQELVKRAVLDTNERVINIESILENQHRIIELLSARSIEQEAKLKRIK